MTDRALYQRENAGKRRSLAAQAAGFIFFVLAIALIIYRTRIRKIIKV